MPDLDDPGSESTDVPLFAAADAVAESVDRTTDAAGEARQMWPSPQGATLEVAKRGAEVARSLSEKVRDAADSAPRAGTATGGIAGDERAAGVLEGAGGVASEATERLGSPLAGQDSDDRTDSPGIGDAGVAGWAPEETVVVDHDAPRPFADAIAPQEGAEVDRARSLVAQETWDRDVTDGTPGQQWDAHSRPDAVPLRPEDLESRSGPDRLALAEDQDGPRDVAHMPNRGEGYYEVVIHGSREGEFEARLDRGVGKMESVPLSTEQLARVIESRPEWSDRPIILTSCSSAASGAELCERLGVAVYAPTDAIDVERFELPNGIALRMDVKLSPGEDGTGRWVRFEPTWSRRE